LTEVDSVCKRSGNTDQAKILAELTGMHYTYVRHFAFDGGSYGLALLSKFPITNTKNNRLPVLTTDNGNTRAFLTSDLTLPGNKKVIAAVAHLDYRSDSSRMDQSEIIVNMFKDEKVPVLLLGDLNAGPQSVSILTLKSLFVDTNRPDYFTYPVTEAINKIDYILVNKMHFKKTVDEPFYDVQFSDHLPILSMIKLK
jgi:endonuclease/exonuclease/phosphatase family metal-dependent hydrolase